MTSTPPKTGRPKASRQVRSDRGRGFGVVLTDRDQQRLMALARWYTLSAAHLTRMELDPRLWHPQHTRLPAGTNTPEYDTQVRKTRERLGNFRRIVERPGTSIGPLVDATRDRTSTTYHVTRFGVTAANIPWQIKPGIYDAFTPHAWFAADIGMQMERAGYRVLSERELATGVDQHHDDIGQRFNSYYEQPNGQRVTKKPDLAVLSPSNDDYIAIEVERAKRKSIRWYTEKLYAYQANSRVRAVWYVCDSTATAERVGRAANTVFGTSSNYPLRVRVADHVNDWFEIPAATRDVKLLADLEAIS